MEKDCDYENDTDNGSPLKYPADASVWSKGLWIVSLPIYLLLTFTVPDCRKFDCRHKLLIVFASFFLSILWIAFFSYILVWMVTIIGYVSTVGTFDAIRSCCDAIVARLLRSKHCFASIAPSPFMDKNLQRILFQVHSQYSRYYHGSNFTGRGNQCSWCNGQCYCGPQRWGWHGCV